MAYAEEGAAAPNQRQGQNQQQKQQQQNKDVAGQRHLHINWSNFKQEFSGKPEDAEAHLLHSNDWMNAHHFTDDVKVQRFCLTLLGKARLWFQSLEPSENTTWPQLQIYLGKGIQNWATHVNNYFMHGDHSILMKTLKLYILMSCK